METFGWKKIITAIGGTVIFVLVVRVIAVAVLEPENLSNPAYIVNGLFVQIPTGGAPPPAEPMPNWKTALPVANIEAGKTIAARCQGCHDLSMDKVVKFGPPLYDLVGRKRAAQPDYDYSEAMRNASGVWTPDELFKFIRVPQIYIPESKMVYAGVKDAKERVDLICNQCADIGRHFFALRLGERWDQRAYPCDFAIQFLERERGYQAFRVTAHDAIFHPNCARARDLQNIHFIVCWFHSFGFASVCSTRYSDLPRDTAAIPSECVHRRLGIAADRAPTAPANPAAC